MEAFAEQAPIGEELDVEAGIVTHWRFEQFSSLGFSQDAAELLSISDADLGTARSLVEAGCPLHLALRILA
jgi:hypothetical protein